ncbi:hypothetical protein CAEBREN_06750 [Caenorhabditis brenneri]|uniref:Uncharacterized protein n=1 Tax=Caenorhabditis brenneri TaxID=135651 RepID=G0NMQ8_CAEBE|nr:hypothetical protein CAEBREN_06750 [Caenorhabditis brenneri]
MFFPGKTLPEEYIPAPEVPLVQETKPAENTKNKLKTLSDLYSILGPHSPYYVLSLTLNALMFAVFNHLNEMDNYLIYSKDDQVYTDDRGRIVETEHPTVIDQNGRYTTSNGGMDLTTLKILNNISSVIGSVLAVMVARWTFHKSIIIFTVLIVASYLLSQAFLFNFFDRIAFVIGCVLSKCLTILTMQAVFESGQGKYRVWAVGFSYYLTNTFVFVTILLFKKDNHNAETYFMFIITGLVGLYTLVCPCQLLHSLVRRDVKRVQRILDKFGISEIPDCSRIVDDILYINRVPTKFYDSLGYLYKIRPFMKKLIVLTILIALQSRMNSGEMEWIKTMLPYSPMESLLISRVIACFASIFAVYGVFKFGRRRLLLSLLFLNLFISYTISLIPIDTYYMCYSRDMPNDQYDRFLKFAFFSWTAIRTCSTITLFVLVLEHIPTIHRSFIFPVVMFFDAVFQSMADSSPYFIAELYDTPQFIRPMIRYSIVSFLLAVSFIDNTDVSVFHTNEIPCYNLTNPLKKAVKDYKNSNFEEHFRTLCEVKALEMETFEEQQKKLTRGYYDEQALYRKRKEKKMGMKEKLKDSSIDSSTREELLENYIRKQERNKKCIESTKRKLTSYDQESKTIVYHIQKNRLKI